MILDLTGYSFTGKSLVYDILEGCSGQKSFGREIEFDLIRAPGGVLDLSNAITPDMWSPIRSHDAICRFQRLAKNLGGKRKRLFDRLCRVGTYYDDLFPSYTSDVDVFLNELVLFSYEAYWPFQLFGRNELQVSGQKVLSKLGLGGREKVYFSRLTKKEFASLAKKFLENLEFGVMSTTEGGRVLILNNVFEPNTPSHLRDMFNNVASIIVDRDPRDVYLSAKKGINTLSNSGSSILGNSVEDFCSRFAKVRSQRPDSSFVTLMYFEDIFQFDTFYSYFEPLDLFSRRDLHRAWETKTKDSAKNISLFRQGWAKQFSKELDFIEKELSGYLRPEEASEI